MPAPPPPIKITNCHVHLFTTRHVPKNYPYFWLRLFKRWPSLIRVIAWVVAFLGQQAAADKLHRMRRFQKEAQKGSQQAILENVKRHYPSNTRFVVLPMEMSAFGYGKPLDDLRAQHDELAKLARHPELGASVIPFATIDPRADPHAQELWRAVDTHAFKGVKIYPRLGFAPDDPVLMQQVYPRLQAEGLPLMTHCSRGGVQGLHLPDHFADLFTEPEAYCSILRKFPDLRVCLAHFGGQRDWQAYVNPEGPDPLRDEFSRNWLRGIRRMIEGGEWPGLWTDISYTLFNFDDYVPFLRMFLLGEDDKHERLRRRVLFGSDFYMTRQEKLSEKAVCFRLRNALGEEVFRRIADENPKVWLGEQEERPW